jgi:hypothetical protein
MMFPMQSIAKVQPAWRTYNWEYVGGMMAFEHKPSFMDSRFDSFEHLGVMAESRNIIEARDAQALLDKYRVDHALVKDNLPIDAFLEHAPGWHVLMREPAWEGNYVLLERNPGAAAP